MIYHTINNGQAISDGQGNIVQLSRGLSIATAKEKAFGAKIIKAMNNTYGEGINPESVPLMKIALVKFISRFTNLWDDIKEGKLLSDNFHGAFIKEAVESINTSKK